MRFKFLKEEPKPKSWYTQLLFCITRPIARFLDSRNYVKLEAIRQRREDIARRQKSDFILEVADVLYSTVLTHGTPPDIQMCKMLCIDEARDIFYEKKSNGGFDDLNIMI